MKESTAVKHRDPNVRLRRVEGRHNALVKELRRAFARGELTRDGCCAIEGLLAKSQAGPLLAIAGVQDPGNLGTILRSAEAFGARGVVLGEGTVSPFNPKVVRASAGSVFRLPTVRVKLEQTLDQLKANNIRLIATSSHKGTRLDEAKLVPP